MAAQLAGRSGPAQTGAMPPERPPTTDAEFQVVHGPWPRWAVSLSLVKFAAWAAGVVAAAILASLAVLTLLGAFD